MPDLSYVGDYMLIDWEAPFNGGATINGYRIEIKTAGMVFTQDLTNCDGSQPDITDATQCIVYIATMMASPFSLPLGETIDVRLLAYNYYGESEYSQIASNLQIVWKPDPIQNLQTHYTPNLAVTDAYKVGLTWDDGPSDNGMPITDYQIQYDQSTDVWQVLKDSVENKYYETTIGLIAGNTYKFRVLARNSVGLSGPTEISVLVAQIPDTPVAPVTAKLFSMRARYYIFHFLKQTICGQTYLSDKQ